MKFFGLSLLFTGVLSLWQIAFALDSGTPARFEDLSSEDQSRFEKAMGWDPGRSEFRPNPFEDASSWESPSEAFAALLKEYFDDSLFEWRHPVASLWFESIYDPSSVGAQSGNPYESPIGRSHSEVIQLILAGPGKELQNGFGHLALGFGPASGGRPQWIVEAVAPDTGETYLKGYEGYRETAEKIARIDADGSPGRLSFMFQAATGLAPLAFTVMPFNVFYSDHVLSQGRVIEALDLLLTVRERRALTHAINRALKVSHLRYHFFTYNCGTPVLDLLDRIWFDKKSLRQSANRRWFWNLSPLDIFLQVRWDQGNGALIRVLD